MNNVSIFQHLQQKTAITVKRYCETEKGHDQLYIDR